MIYLRAPPLLYRQTWFRMIIVWSVVGIVCAVLGYIFYDFWQALKKRYSPLMTVKETYTLPAVPHQYSVDELAQYNGEGGNAILICLKGVVYDVTSHSTGRQFYGKGAGYFVFAGKDASRALATMDFAQVDNRSLEGLTEEQMQTLDDWKLKYDQKYAVVGSVQ